MTSSICAYYVDMKGVASLPNLLRDPVRTQNQGGDQDSLQQDSIVADSLRVRLPVLCLVAAGLVTGACDSLVLDISLQNRTGEPVMVYDLVNGQEIEVIRVETAYGTVYPSTCTSGPLVVRTLDGELVATSPRLCEPTEWEITWGSEGPPATGTFPVDR